jgi:hypothetical protein
MKAEICDRCGAMWKDTLGCEVSVRNITIIEDGDRTGDHFDLCEECYKGLYSYINEKKPQKTKTKNE